MHLAYNRKIELSDERREYFMRTMHDERLTEYQYKKAKDWIMYGDWTMRGADPTVTLEDFYPTGQMMDSVRNRQIMMQREQPSKGQPMSNDEFKAFQKRYLDTDGFKQ